MLLKSHCSLIASSFAKWKLMWVAKSFNYGTVVVVKHYKQVTEKVFGSLIRPTCFM